MTTNGVTESNEPTKVFLVHPLVAFAESLAGAIEREDDLEWSGSAATIDRAMDDVHERSPDVVLLDAARWGIASAYRMTQACRDARVVILVEEVDADVLSRAAEVRASGVLGIGTSLAAVLRAIRIARDGGMLVDAAALSGLVRSIRLDQRASEDRMGQGSFTPREVSILDAMSEGMDPRAMAGKFGISVQTVRGHVKSILRKLGAHSQLEAVVVAVKRGLVGTP